MSYLTVEEVKSLVSYDPATGVFTRLASASFNPKARIGAAAGSRNKNGYWQIRVGQKRYMLHRLAWFITHGDWPVGDVDHINGDPSDNRLCNLRQATRSQNMANARRPAINTSGSKGVTYDKVNEKWVAQMQVNATGIHIGRFDTLFDAVAARRSAFNAAFGEFARP